MKNVLIVCSVSSMIEKFNMHNIGILKDLGYSVFVATNFDQHSTIPSEESKLLKEKLISQNIKVFDLPFSRNPFSLQNIKSYIKLNKIMKEYNFELVHAQSPVGGALARIANYMRRDTRAKLIYTAHGFHFFDGAPLINWIIYYPIEYILSFMTDLLITINEEDYKRSQNFKSGDIFKIPGVGVNTEFFSARSEIKNSLKNDFQIKQDDYIISSVGELNTNKNHIAIIEAMKLLNNSKIHYFICGIGSEKEALEQKIEEYGLIENVHLLGYRKDIKEILFISDIFAFPSKREGLGLAAIEAMSVGLPIITSNVHGINDYSEDGKTGFKVHPNDYEGFAYAIQKIIDFSNDDLEKIVKYNKRISKLYDQKHVDKLMRKVYVDYLQSE